MHYAYQALLAHYGLHNMSAATYFGDVGRPFSDMRGIALNSLMLC